MKSLSRLFRRETEEDRIDQAIEDLARRTRERISGIAGPAPHIEPETFTERLLRFIPR